MFFLDKIIIKTGVKIINLLITNALLLPFRLQKVRNG
jgi:hypothetical protein